MVSKLIQPNALALGWISLLLGLFIPSTVSANAVLLFWNLPCTEGVRWTAAPLIVGCEPLSRSQLALGWVATVASLLALASATGVAIYACAIFARARDKRRTAPHVCFSAATSAVATVITLVLVSNPDATFNATGAWIALSSFAGLATAAVAAIASLAVRSAALQSGRR